MVHLMDERWQLEKWKYCWSLVGLMWTEVGDDHDSSAHLHPEMCFGRRGMPSELDRITAVVAFTEDACCCVVKFITKNPIYRRKHFYLGENFQ